MGLDLDSRTPAARSFDDKLSLAEPYFAAHHVSVKPGEQAVFTVRAFTSKCYCEWELLIEAVVDGKDQVFPVKDGDQPFRTTAFAKSYETIYSFDFFGGTGASSFRQAPSSHLRSPARDGQAAFSSRRQSGHRKASDGAALRHSAVQRLNGAPV